MTIGEMIDKGWTVRVYCEARNCHRGADVDLAALAARLGRDHGALHADLVGHFRCACGSRHVSFRLSPNVPQVHVNWHGGR
jgi:hypothetical protein